MNAYPRSAILISHGTDTLACMHAAVRYAVKHEVPQAPQQAEIRGAAKQGIRPPGFADRLNDGGWFGVL